MNQIIKNLQLSIKNTTEKELLIDFCSPSTFKQDGLIIINEDDPDNNIDLLFDLKNNQIKTSLIRIQSTSCQNAFIHPIYYKVFLSENSEITHPIYPLSYMSIFQEQACTIDIPIDVYLSNETELTFKINPCQSIIITCFISEIGKLNIDKEFTPDSSILPVMIRNNGKQKQEVKIFDLENFSEKENNVEKSIVNNTSYLQACSQLKEHGLDFDHIFIYSDNIKNFNQYVNVGGVESALLSDYRQPYQEQSNLLMISNIGNLKMRPDHYTIKMEIEAKSMILIYLMTESNNKFILRKNNLIYG
ncbi:MAG: hypothetical protein KAI81_07785 [Candidatus Marinimicrobia bacterium]|nr:hypothetical protein [Candidatus Neomarinimicrobiota bacterium]